MRHKGTFMGVAEKIPYLKELGVNQLLLMPIYDFDERILPEKENWTFYRFGAGSIVLEQMRQGNSDRIQSKRLSPPFLFKS